MKYIVYFNAPMKVEFDSDAEDRENLESHALWHAKRAARQPAVDIVQILPEGVKSQLLRDQPSDRGPLAPPPMPPLGSAGDLMLQRAA